MFKVVCIREIEMNYLPGIVALLIGIVFLRYAYRLHKWEKSLARQIKENESC